jgi:hypothetical protein
MREDVKERFARGPDEHMKKLLAERGIEVPKTFPNPEAFTEVSELRQRAKIWSLSGFAAFIGKNSRSKNGSAFLRTSASCCTHSKFKVRRGRKSVTKLTLTVRDAHRLRP